MSQADVRFKTFSEYRGQQHIQIDKEKFDWSHCMRRLVKNRIEDETEGFAPQLHEEWKLERKEVGSTPVETQVDTTHSCDAGGTKCISLRRIMCTATSTQREQSYRSYSIFQKFVFSQHCSCFQVSRMDTMEWINCRSHDTLLSLFSVLVSLVQRPVSTCIHYVEKS